MSIWDLIVNRKIEEAAQNGAFDVPEAKGKQLNLADDPNVPEEKRLAYKIMKDNDVAPDWIMDNREIRETISGSVSRLQVDYRYFQDALRRYEGKVDVDSIYARHDAYKSWDASCARFRESSKRINKLIDTYNLRVPISSLQRLYFNAERVIERIESGKGLN